MKVRNNTKSGGFTLVELLVVVAIIMMLAGMAMGVMHMATEAAKESKTNALVAKLNRVVQLRYDSYRTRRVVMYTIDPNGNPGTRISVGNMDPRDAAKCRLNAIRDIMRMEMPERYSDIELKPYGYNGPTEPIPHIVQGPGLWRRYQAIHQAQEDALTDKLGGDRTAARQLLTLNGSAECLYMTVASSADDKKLFHDNEIGDVDEDGAPEFIDGWGNPIQFLRWAPDFADSDIQVADPETHPDPFDTRKIENRYRLIPLVYSGGPDGEPGVNVGLNHRYRGNPYQSGIGEATGSEHYDNIHNHRIESN